MKTAVVLSGGGAKGGFEAGALEGILAAGIVPDAYYGTSVGALNAVTMALHGIARLQQEWRSISGQSDVISPKFPLALPWSTGLYSMAPLRKRLERLVEEGKTDGPEGVVCYVDMADGSIGYATTRDPGIAKYVEASACIPVAMELVDDRYADGGLREQTPLKRALDDGAERIVVILCNPVTPDLTGPIWEPGFPKLLSTAMRSAEVMSHEIFLNDLHVCRRKNRIEGYREIDLTVIAPEKSLKDTLDFSPERIDADMLYGLQMAKQVLVNKTKEK
jgi:predicted acylesterase/phospholipase RssA